MDFSCKREALMNAVQVAKRATDSKSSIQILRNVMMKAEGNALELFGFNHRMGIRNKIECTVNDTGVTTCPADLLMEVLGVLSDDDINCQIKNDLMTIKCGKSRYQVQCANSDDFPAFPNNTYSDVFELSTDVLMDGVKRTIFAANPDDPRAFMGGVLIKTVKGCLHFVATDGNRLALKTIENDSIKGTINALVPKTTMSELSKVLSSGKNEVIKISVDKKNITFEAGDVFLHSRLIEADYPGYEKVIPKTFNGEAVINKNKMTVAVRGVSIMARSKENKNRIELKTQQDSVVLSADTHDVGCASEEVNAVSQGDVLEAALNSQFILDFLGVTNSDDITVKYVDDASPSLWIDNGDDSYTYIVMPIKV